MTLGVVGWMTVCGCTVVDSGFFSMSGVDSVAVGLVVSAGFLAVSCAGSEPAGPVDSCFLMTGGVDSVAVGLVVSQCRFRTETVPAGVVVVFSRYRRR